MTGACDLPSSCGLGLVGLTDVFVQVVVGVGVHPLVPIKTKFVALDGSLK